MTATEPFTPEAFARLPFLLDRATFLAWSGLSDRDLDAGVADGTIPVYRPKKNGYRKYYKQTLAQMRAMQM